jgi:hypothetical protein
MSEMPMVCGLFVTLGDEEAIQTVAVYVPAGRLPSVGVRVTVDGAEVGLSLAVSHPLAPNP